WARCDSWRQSGFRARPTRAAMSTAQSRPVIWPVSEGYPLTTPATPINLLAVVRIRFDPQPRWSTKHVNNPMRVTLLVVLLLTILSAVAGFQAERRTVAAAEEEH